MTSPNNVLVAGATTTTNMKASVKGVTAVQNVATAQKQIAIVKPVRIEGNLKMNDKKPLPGVMVRLNEEDLWFISESISCNVPSSDDMTHEQKKTFRKIQRAENRMHKLLNNNSLQG